MVFYKNLSKKLGVLSKERSKDKSKVITVNTSQTTSVNPSHRRKKGENTNFYYGNVVNNRLKNLKYVEKSPQKKNVSRLVIFRRN